MSRPSQFVDKRGSELKKSEPLLKFPLNFRLKLRDWGSTSPLGYAIFEPYYVQMAIFFKMDAAKVSIACIDNF